MKDAKDILLPPVSPEVASRLCTGGDHSQIQAACEWQQCQIGPRQGRHKGQLLEWLPVLCRRTVPRHKPHILALDECRGVARELRMSGRPDVSRFMGVTGIYLRQGLDPMGCPQLPGSSASASRPQRAFFLFLSRRQIEIGFPHILQAKLD